MELVEGKTLREHIAGRPMPIKDALRIGTATEDGLTGERQPDLGRCGLKLVYDQCSQGNTGVENLSVR